MFLLDSDYLINFLNGQQKAIGVVSNLRELSLYTYTSIICVAEVLEGIYGLKSEEKSLQFEAFLETIGVLGIDLAVARQFALSRGKLRRQGKLIDNLDLFIAATCLAKDLILVTENIDHFRRIPRLKIYKA